ncbi:MAG TPA: hypothetical protein DIT93_12775 [Pelagibacterium sp.]|nr:hypothetical protein [Pelagibacterium sp.]
MPVPIALVRALMASSPGGLAISLLCGAFAPTRAGLIAMGERSRRLVDGRAPADSTPSMMRPGASKSAFSKPSPMSGPFIKSGRFLPK